MLKKSYNEKADIYSFGITLWEMLTGNIYLFILIMVILFKGEQPYKSTNYESYEQLIDLICKENLRPTIPFPCPEKLKVLFN